MINGTTQGYNANIKLAGARFNPFNFLFCFRVQYFQWVYYSNFIIYIRILYCHILPYSYINKFCIYNLKLYMQQTVGKSENELKKNHKAGSSSHINRLAAYVCVLRANAFIYLNLMNKWLFSLYFTVFIWTFFNKIISISNKVQTLAINQYFLHAPNTGKLLWIRQIID